MKNRTHYDDLVRHIYLRYFDVLYAVCTYIQPNAACYAPIVGARHAVCAHLCFSCYRRACNIDT